MFALGQTKKKKTEENKVRQTKKDLKDVTITNTIEKGEFLVGQTNGRGAVTHAISETDVL